MNLFKKCPRCGSTLLYVDEHEKTITFNVTQSGEILFQNENNSLVINEEKLIHCVSCSWEGTIKELK